ncbi:unnamed protein product [Moneuplotes crassus]|uniref:RING-type domain-containing protein n=1 Tax=Euplotes crassus TaxID=5936 RepID=A0AAD1XC45_EUPCR|nr:unnamed protein product [Moneuplotes crassus]
MECELCYEEFDADIRVAKSIHPCGHSFCDSCIMRIWKDRIVRCPICRTMQPTHVKMPKTNYALMKLIQLEKIDVNVFSENILDINEEALLNGIDDLNLQRVTSNEVVLNQLQQFDDKIKEMRKKESAKVDNNECGNLKISDKNNFVNKIKLKKDEELQEVSEFRNQKLRSYKKYSFSKNSIFLKYFISKNSTWFLWMLRKGYNCKHSYSCLEHLSRNLTTLCMVYGCFRPLIHKMVLPSLNDSIAEDDSSKILLVEGAICLLVSLYRTRHCLANYLREM